MKKHEWHFALLCIGILGIWACHSGNQSDDEVRGIETHTMSDFIQSPVSAEGIDTANVAKMAFDQPMHDFGTVDEGEIVEHDFHFTNSGKKPLIISTANSTCGCTVPEWPREPIEPGAAGKITVRFNTNGKTLNQTKPVSIFANTWPNETKVYLKGKVKPKN